MYDPLRSTNYVYDPIVLGFDSTTFTRTSGGSDPTVASTKLRFTSNGMDGKYYHRYFDLRFRVNVPTAPATGDDKTWGMRVAALYALTPPRAMAVFNITDAVFSVICYDDSGNVIANQTIPWEAAWTNAEVEYRIVYGRDGIKFIINGRTYVKKEMSGSAPNPNLLVLSKVPMSPHIRNGDADNLDMGCFIVSDASLS
jgi:hypothetical protein